MRSRTNIEGEDELEPGWWKVNDMSPTEYHNEFDVEVVYKVRDLLRCNISDLEVLYDVDFLEHNMSEIDDSLHFNPKWSKRDHEHGLTILSLTHVSQSDKNVITYIEQVDIKPPNNTVHYSFWRKIVVPDPIIAEFKLIKRVMRRYDEGLYTRKEAFWVIDKIITKAKNYVHERVLTGEE